MPGEAAGTRTRTDDVFGPARAVADAVLYEGYSLFPYRASAAKNHLRWQFGVLVPPGYEDTAEPSRQLTECLVEGDDATRVCLRVRFLHLCARSPEVDDGVRGRREVASITTDDGEAIPWDEGVEETVDVEARLGDLLAGEQEVCFDIPGSEAREPLTREGRTVGRFVRRTWPLSGTVRISARRLSVEDRTAFRLRVQLDNATPWDRRGVPRQEALRSALIGAHTMLAVVDGAFVSLLDPPSWAQEAAARCRNVGTYPVLVGDEGRTDLMLSSPIVLYDHPRIAPESQGDLFDATEIDELLTFSTLSLTDEEKREARATDERVRTLIDRVDATTPEQFRRLHGAIRSRSLIGASGDDVLPVGTQVRLRPQRRADLHDMFLEGRTATVEGTVRDVDGTLHLAVTIDDDPGADLNRTQGRFHFFAPEEVEPLEEAR